MDRVDVIVIGAGVVGLAVAAQLAKSGKEVVVLEQHDAIGTETSSRNSEVIHAGIYYPEGSLKDAFVFEGRSCSTVIVANEIYPSDSVARLLSPQKKNKSP